MSATLRKAGRELTMMQREENRQATETHAPWIPNRWAGVFQCVHCGQVGGASACRPNMERLVTCRGCGEPNVVVFLYGTVAGAYCMELEWIAKGDDD